MKAQTVKIFLISSVIAPVGIFIHELLHLLFLELGGVKATLKRFSYAAPVNFSYDIEGLTGAMEFYNSDRFSLFMASFIPPVFTLLLAFVFLCLYSRYRRGVCFAAALSPLVLRVAALTVRFPRFLDGTIGSTDEANSAWFLGVNPLIIYLPSVILGYLVIFLALKKTGKEDRLRYLLAASLGGFLGFGLVEILFNHCYI